MKKVSTAIYIALVAGLTVPSFGQGAKESEAKTKLQSFDQQFGSVVIKGYSKAGTVSGLYGSAVTVESKEFMNAVSGSKLYGLTIEVTGSGSSKREHTSYLDYDEIPSLLKGLEYIKKVDKTATKLDGFEATYKTKDDLVFTVFSSDGGTKVAVESGRIGAATAYFKFEDLDKVSSLITAAKSKLDSIK